MSWEGAIPLNFGTKRLDVIYIWRPGDAAGAPTINGAAMTELARGIYYYDYAGWTLVGQYSIECALVANGLYAGGTVDVVDYGRITSSGE